MKIRTLFGVWGISSSSRSSWIGDGDLGGVAGDPIEPEAEDPLSDDGVPGLSSSEVPQSSELTMSPWK